MIDLTQLPILPLIILIPYLSIIPILLFDRKHSYNISIAASFISFILTLLVVYASTAGQTLSFSVPYINYLNINLSLQVTHLNLMLLLMTSIIFLAVSLVGKHFIKDEHKQYNVIFAIAEGSCLAIFLAANLFLFYIFWELAEIMMFFIIFIYGGFGRKSAATKFIVYSLASSLLLLIAIIMIYTSVTPHTFDILTIIKDVGTAHQITQATQLTIMALLLLSFMIKMPVFPFHSWLPDAHTEAPTTGSMILAGVLLKFGGYGLLLMFLMIPISLDYTKYMAVVFGFSAIYAAFAAMRQGNLKRAIAYTSITDMGIVAVGVAAYGILGSNGALYAMLSHGIVISLLFLIAGTVGELYGTLEIAKIKGIIRNFPVITYFFIFGAVALVGIPLTAGFIGDLLIFLASTQVFGVIGVLPLVGIIVMGALMFWLIERMFLSKKETHQFHHIDKLVIVSCILLSVSSIVLGIFPSILLHAI